MITLTQSLRESEFLKLKPSPYSPLKNLDYVFFTDIEGKKWYAQIEYSDIFCSFILNYYVDSNFKDLKLDDEGAQMYNFVYQIGLSNLKLV